MANTQICVQLLLLMDASDAPKNNFRIIISTFDFKSVHYSVILE